MELHFIFRFIAALFAVGGIYYGYKMFSLVRFTKYWSFSWVFLGIAFLLLLFRRIFLLVNDIPCEPMTLEVTATIVSSCLFFFSYFINKFFVKFLGLDRCKDLISKLYKDKKDEVKEKPTCLKNGKK